MLHLGKKGKWGQVQWPHVVESIGAKLVELEAGNPLVDMNGMTPHYFSPGSTYKVNVSRAPGDCLSLALGSGFPSSPPSAYSDPHMVLKKVGLTASWLPCRAKGSSFLATCDLPK